MELSKILFICLTLGLILLVINHKLNSNSEKITGTSSIADINNHITLEKALTLIKAKYGDGKKQINGNYKEYKYKFSTISFNLKNEVQVMTCNILKDINSYTDSNFRISDYESIVKKIDKAQNNILYNIVFFILEPNEHIRRKLNIEIFYNIQNNLIHVNKLQLLNSEPNIIANNTNKFYINTDIQKIKNSNDNDNINGLQNTSLEHSLYINNNRLNNILNSKTQNIRNNSIETKQLELVPSSVSKFPCRELDSCWDVNGVLFEKNTSDSKCCGINSATKYRPVTGLFNPTLSSLHREDLENNHLFDRGVGIPNLS